MPQYFANPFGPVPEIEAPAKQALNLAISNEEIQEIIAGQQPVLSKNARAANEDAKAINGHAKTPLRFEERADGYRVCRIGGGVERMVASIGTKVLTGYVPTEKKDGAAIYSPLPRKECTIHSSAGAMLVGDIEEILAQLPVE